MIFILYFGILWSEFESIANKCGGEHFKFLYKRKLTSKYFSLLIYIKSILYFSYTKYRKGREMDAEKKHSWVLILWMVRPPKWHCSFELVQYSSFFLHPVIKRCYRIPPHFCPKCFQNSLIPWNPLTIFTSFGIFWAASS